jgi:hypothetical protein
MARQETDLDLQDIDWPSAPSDLRHGPEVATDDARVWPARLTPRGPASSWRWGDGGDGDTPRQESAEVRIALPGSASITLRAVSLVAPIDGRCAVTLRASPAVLRRLLETVAERSAREAEIEDRDLLAIEVGSSRLTVDLLDATLRLTPAGSLA